MMTEYLMTIQIVLLVMVFYSSSAPRGGGCRRTNLTVTSNHLIKLNLLFHSIYQTTISISDIGRTLYEGK